MVEEFNLTSEGGFPAVRSLVLGRVPGKNHQLVNTVTSWLTPGRRMRAWKLVFWSDEAV